MCCAGQAHALQRCELCLCCWRAPRRPTPEALELMFHVPLHSLSENTPTVNIHLFGGSWTRSAAHWERAGLHGYVVVERRCLKTNRSKKLWEGQRSFPSAWLGAGLLQTVLGKGRSLRELACDNCGKTGDWIALIEMKVCDCYGRNTVNRGL